MFELTKQINENVKSVLTTSEIAQRLLDNKEIRTRWFQMIDSVPIFNKKELLQAANKFAETHKLGLHFRDVRPSGTHMNWYVHRLDELSNEAG